MGDLARAGIAVDGRLIRARMLLSKLYGGRRIDALDALLLPAWSLSAASPVGSNAASNVPTFWIDMADPARAAEERFLAYGVTRAMRTRVHKLPEGSDDELRSAYARARFELGRVSWRRVDFVEAAHAAKGSAKPSDRLVLAVSLALARGPSGAAEMMRVETPAQLTLRHTEALDSLVAEGGPLAGMAAFDAAHLRALAPPQGDEAIPYLKDVAARFRNAEIRLKDPAQKRAAAQRATEIDTIVGAAATKEARTN